MKINKKNLMLQITLTIIICVVFIYFLFQFIKAIVDYNISLDSLPHYSAEEQNYLLNIYNQQFIPKVIINAIFAILTCIASLIAVFSLLKIIKPNIIQKMEAKKQEKISKKTTDRELKRQQKIKELQKQLDELKKDD